MTREVNRPFQGQGINCKDDGAIRRRITGVLCFSRGEPFMLRVFVSLCVNYVTCRRGGVFKGILLVLHLCGCMCVYRLALFLVG